MMIIFIFTSYSFAQNWKTFVPEDKSKEQVMQYDDEGKKKVSEAVTRVWIKIEKKEQTETKKGASPIVKSLFLIEINCNEKNYRTLSIAEYDKNGKLMNSLNFDDASWYFIVPESTMSYLQKSICQK
ncbi:MAG: hypothetical protein N2738_04470 [Thermodesulfovibrionales bacterium]|nr:hypothetical protein [Thermodesulfovibrionales bacterium]